MMERAWPSGVRDSGAISSSPFWPLTSAAGSTASDHPEQVTQGVAEPGIGQLVAATTTLRHRHDQTATPQTGQMIGQALPRHPDQLGQIGGIARRLP